MSQQYMSLEEDPNQPQYDENGQYIEPQYDPNYDENGQYIGEGAYTDDDLHTQQTGVLSEAVNRIQQAKLYETLISAKLFSPGSADPGILDIVEGELRAFAIGKLEELLGMKAPASAAPVVASPFDDEQVQVLAMLANRALKRNIVPTMAPTPTPSINPISAQEQPRAPLAPLAAASNVQPTLNPIGAPAPRAAPPRAAPQRRAPAPQPPQRPAPQRATRTQGRKPLTNNSSKSGKDMSQAVGRRRKPLAMPPQSTIDSLHANQAESNARGASNITAGANAPMSSPGRSANVGQALAQLIAQETK